MHIFSDIIEMCQTLIFLNINPFFYAFFKNHQIVPRPSDCYGLNIYPYWSGTVRERNKKVPLRWHVIGPSKQNEGSHAQNLDLVYLSKQNGEGVLQKIQISLPIFTSTYRRRF